MVVAGLVSQDACRTFSIIYSIAGLDFDTGQIFTLGFSAAAFQIESSHRVSVCRPVHDLLQWCTREWVCI